MITRMQLGRHLTEALMVIVIHATELSYGWGEKSYAAAHCCTATSLPAVCACTAKAAGRLLKGQQH